MENQTEADRLRIRQAYLHAGVYGVSVVEFGLVRTFIDYKVFDIIPDEGDISVSELSQKVGGEKELLERYATFLIAAEILASPAPGRVAHTPKSRLYKSDEPTAALMVHVFNMLLRPVAQLPTFFAKHGLASPKNAKVTPIGLAMGHPDKDVYEILVAEPELHKEFNNALRSLGPMYSLKGVYDFGWVHGALTGVRPAIVDVGGSSGLALRDILRNNTGIPAERCILMDIPKVIESTKNNLDESLRSVSLVGANMFEPYPEAVRGAVLYQFRRVLNDFPDDDVLRILRTVREAAAPDTRILIIEEMLRPDRHVMNVAMDIFLMCAGGKKRNAAMFSELAGRAGFRLNAEFQNTSKDFDDYGVLEFVVA